MPARPQVSPTQRRPIGLPDAIATQVNARDDATLNALRTWLGETLGGAASIGLTWNTLARLGLTLKKRRCGQRSRRAPTLPPPVMLGGRRSPS